MLEVIFGTKARELTLQYLLTFKEGYAREIAKCKEELKYTL